MYWFDVFKINTSYWYKHQRLNTDKGVSKSNFKNFDYFKFNMFYTILWVLLFLCLGPGIEGGVNITSGWLWGLGVALFADLIWWGGLKRHFAN